MSLRIQTWRAVANGLFFLAQQQRILQHPATCFQLTVFLRGWRSSTSCMDLQIALLSIAFLGGYLAFLSTS